MATTALGLASGTNGSVERFSGMAGVPAGLPKRDGSSLNSNLGLALTTALLPEFSSAPPSIHLRISSISASGILGELGGILGSSLCEINQEERAALGVARLDHLARAAPLHGRAVIVEVQPPFCLSGLWHDPQRLRKMAATLSW